jgi:hypothetical protein
VSYLGNQDLVAGLYARGDTLSLLVECTRSDCQHLGLIQLLHSGLGEEDAGRGLSLRLEALDEDAVEKRGD